MGLETSYQHINIGVLPSGKAQDFDSCIRWFESTYPSQYVPLAQSVEHCTFNAGVLSSSLRRDTSFVEGYPSGHKGADLKSVVVKAPRVRILPPPPIYPC